MFVRERIKCNNKKKIEYNIKLAIKDIDSSHIQHFINDLDSNYPIHFYKTVGFNKEIPSTEARVFITNNYMGSLLYETLGIVPYRKDANKVIEHIPKEFHKYFILGLFDADGSFTAYQRKDYGKKLNVTFGGSETLLNFIEKHLIENNIISPYNEGRKLCQRHKNKDGVWRTLVFSGKIQGMKILDYLYDSPIYLERKYKKYLELPYHNN